MVYDAINGYYTLKFTQYTGKHIEVVDTALQSGATYSLVMHLTRNYKKLAESKAYSIPSQCADGNPVNFSKIIFSALNFFMHIFNISATYLPCIKRMHWKL